MTYWRSAPLASIVFMHCAVSRLPSSALTPLLHQDHHMNTIPINRVKTLPRSPLFTAVISALLFGAATSVSASEPFLPDQAEGLPDGVVQQAHAAWGLSRNHQRQRTWDRRVAADVAHDRAAPFAPARSMPVASVETAASGDPASWRTDEFKADWGLGAIGADYACARGLSGQGVRLGC